MRLFLTAFGFLTVVPIPFGPGFREGDLGRSMRHFPLVGLAVGALVAGTDLGLAAVFPETVRNVLLVTILVLVTGCFHLDGLADVADAFAARGPRERFLEVMKDPRSGPVGVAAVSLSLFLRVALLGALPAEGRTVALLLFPVAGRYAQAVFTVGSKRARPDGLGVHFAGQAGMTELFVASVETAAALVFLGGIPAGIAAAGAVFAALLSRRYFHARLGGITGDTIGFTSEIAEIIFLLGVVAFARI